MEDQTYQSKEIRAGFKCLAVMFFVMNSLLGYSQIISIPDLHFLSALVEEGIDTNHDSLIQFSEAQPITKLMLHGKDISDLTGIEGFVSLTYLDCSFNDLEIIDLSKNVNLRHLDCICSITGQTKTTLNLRKNTKLTHLACGFNLLEELDLSQNTALEYVNCSSCPRLFSTDFSNNVRLRELHCAGSSLQGTRLGTHPDLRIIDCSSNGSNFLSLDVGGCPSLEYLDGRSNSLRHLDVSHNPLLKFLHAGDSLYDFDVRWNTHLEYLACGGSFSQLDLSKNIALTSLELYASHVTHLDLGANVNLRHLICSGSFEQLDLSHQLTLKSLHVINTPLSSLHLSKNSELESLKCIGTSLQELDLSKNVSLLNANFISNKFLQKIYINCTQVNFKTVWQKDENATWVPI